MTETLPVFKKYMLIIFIKGLSDFHQVLMASGNKRMLLQIGNNVQLHKSSDISEAYATHCTTKSSLFKTRHFPRY